MHCLLLVYGWITSNTSLDARIVRLASATGIFQPVLDQRARLIPAATKPEVLPVNASMIQFSSAFAMLEMPTSQIVLRLLVTATVSYFAWNGFADVR